METLPPEMVAKIGQYLPPEDLARCCAVSVLWREVFGCDELWRPYCEADSEDYLRTTPCLVEPKFVHTESEDTTLSPVGQWRALYMRENHLRRNWIQGNCIDEVTFSCQDAHFLNNDFVLTASDDVVRLIDTTVMPPACVSEFDIIKDHRYRGIHGREKKSRRYGLAVARSDMFIICYRGSTIQVVSVDCESYAMSLKHTFCVREDEEILKFAVVGTSFVVFDDILLRIWDVETATKVEAECPMEDDGDGELDFWVKLIHDRQCENMALTGVRYHESAVYGEEFHCFVYNVKELRFWPFTKKSKQEIFDFAIVDQFVGLYMDSLEIYNYQTSQLIYDSNKGCLAWPRPGMVVKALGNGFVISKGNERNEGRLAYMSPKRMNGLVQLCPSTGVMTYLGPDTGGIYSPFSDKLLHVMSTEDGVESKTWMAMKTLIFQVSIPATFQASMPGPFRINQACTKLLYGGEGRELKMASFW